MRGRALALAVAAGSLLALAVARVSGGGPTIYDGLCTGQVQYRFLGGHPAPPSASAQYTAAQLGSTQFLADDQSMPQAQIIVGAGTLAVPAGASSVTLTIEAVKPPPVRPSGRIDGNVYQFRATAGGTDVPAAADHPVTIVLGSTGVANNLILERFDGAHWKALRTFPSNCGTTFDAASAGFGLFALVASTSAGGPGGGFPAVLIVVIVVVVLAAVIVAIRVSRGRGRSRHPRPRGGRRR